MPTGVSPSAKSSRVTGTTRRPGSSAVNSSKLVVAGTRVSSSSRRVGSSVGRSGRDALPHLERVAVEAGARAGVAGRADLLDRDEQRVRVAVEGGGAHVLHVARGVALAPVLLSRAGPEGHSALGERAPHGLPVHPAEHEHLAGALLLDD